MSRDERWRGGRFGQFQVAPVGDAPPQACPFKKQLGRSLFFEGKHKQTTTNMPETQMCVVPSRKRPGNASSSPYRPPPLSLLAAVGPCGLAVCPPLQQPQAFATTEARSVYPTCWSGQEPAVPPGLVQALLEPWGSQSLSPQRGTSRLGATRSAPAAPLSPAPGDSGSTANIP